MTTCAAWCWGLIGALAGMQSGSSLIDHTTASAQLARELYATAQQQGVAFVDAPVSGGQKPGRKTGNSPSCAVATRPPLPRPSR